MDEMIWKQDAIDAICEDGTWLERQGCMEITMVERKYRDVDIIENLPTIQLKHGKWEYHSNPNIGINLESAYCSCCGFYVDTTGNIDFDEYNFCPHCGADMRGEQE